MRTFLVVWFGQVVSSAASQITAFGLGIWIYQRTGSATIYGWLMVAGTVPHLLASPWAGVFVDRWNRRVALLFRCAGGGICALVLALLFWREAMPLWAVLSVLAVASTFNAFESPALSALVSEVVPRQQLGRANGMVQFGLALGRIMGPWCGGLLLARFGITAILSIDVASFVLAMVTLLLTPREPLERLTHPKGERAVPGFDLLFGFRYIVRNPGLRSLLGLFLIANFNLGIVQVAVTSLVLEFSTAQALGYVLSIGGIGMLVGSLIMIAWGGPRRQIRSLLQACMLQGGCLLASSAHRSVPLIATCAFGVLFTLSFINACSQSAWQRIVPLEGQGRVFAARSMVAQASMPLAYLVGGPLLDGVLSKSSMSVWLGTSGVAGILDLDPGRGAALLLALLGLITMASTAFGMTRRELLALDNPGA